MEPDKQLIKILSHSTEGVSPGFTDAVMNRINALSAPSLSYRPLVTSRLQRIFIFIFGSVVVTILGLCLIIALNNAHAIISFPDVELANIEFNEIYKFIITFWVVFSLNSLYKKKVFGYK